MKTVNYAGSLTSAKIHEMTGIEYFETNLTEILEVKWISVTRKINFQGVRLMSEYSSIILSSSNLNLFKKVIRN